MPPYIKQTVSIIMLLLAAKYTCAQSKKLTVLNTNFEIETQYIQNEWQTTDTVNVIYELVNGNRTYMLNYYTFKDNGGDCNNLFWDKSKLEVQNDSLVFSTQYFQKTGLDPIPEFRKQIFIVTKDGRVDKIFDKYKYRNKDTWVDK